MRTTMRIAGKAGEDDVALVAGGVAFYAFLSIFPAIACALMVWGVFTTETELRTYLGLLNSVVPDSAYRLISDQMVRIADSQTAGLSWGALFSLLLALWSASRAANALLIAVAVTYDRHDKRGFIQQNLIALGFTAGGIIFALLSLAAIGAVPPIIEALQLGAFIDALLRILRWIGLLSLFLGGIYVFYRIARPHGVAYAQARRRPVLPGTLVAGTIWLAASVGFSFYLGNFADYNQTFGSLGAAVALLMWLWLSAVAICVGAETNGVLSREVRAKEHTGD
ncbi:YihY/virulence factor BrkB family protein [Henriciella aquimarina]|uniref:YihY/virulence factor BrkB family protein n=1 Tax=Henriciella aquimarina TaxID=545261 RepID=UPI001301C9D8|nr:YihY/virulence factor BrkB family protein [Henriciella aquimarina]